jgi:hypothetical protein
MTKRMPMIYPRHIFFRCGEEDYNALQARAKERGQSVADVIRKSLFGGRGRPPNDIIHSLAVIATRLSVFDRSGTATPEVAAVLDEIRSTIRILAQLRR